MEKNELLIFLTPKIVNPELLKQAFNMSKGGQESQIEPSNSFNDQLEDLEDELDEL